MSALAVDDLLSDTALSGSGFALAYSDRIDAWLSEVAADARLPPEAALVAIGGYGRRELAPHSDLDIALVHRDGVDVDASAEALLYPIWDAGLKVGHRVDTVDGLCRLAATDLETATALLDVRLLAGDPSLAEELAATADRQWRRDGVARLLQLSERVTDLHSQHGEVAFLLGPNIKSGRGGCETSRLFGGPLGPMCSTEPTPRRSTTPGRHCSGSGSRCIG